MGDWETGGHPHTPGRGVPLHPRKGYKSWEAISGGLGAPRTQRVPASWGAPLHPRKGYKSWGGDKWGIGGTPHPEDTRQQGSAPAPSHLPVPVSGGSAMTSVWQQMLNRVAIIVFFVLVLLSPLLYDLMAG